MSITSISTANSTGASARPDTSEFLQKMFARLDGDSDGKVTQGEFSTAMGKRFGQSEATGASDRPDAATIFQETDSDGDGAITATEFETAFKAMRASKSTGGDSAHGPRGAGGPPPGPPPSGGPGGPSGTSASEEAAQVFDEMDTDKDGKVSAEELLAALKKKAEENEKATSASKADSATPDFAELVAAIDADGDGNVTQSELTGLFEQMRPPHSANEPVGYDASGKRSPDAAVGDHLSTVA